MIQPRFSLGLLPRAIMTVAMFAALVSLWPGTAIAAANAAAGTSTAVAGTASAAPAYPQASVVDSSSPSNLIETAANAMIGELEAHRAQYRKDPTRLHRLVDDILLPHFDVDYAGRLVLGRNWTAATPEQRQRFIKAFYDSLLNNYGDALIDFTGDRIRVLHTPLDPTATNATVRTEVKGSRGQRISVNYSMRRTAQGWKAWDVVIDGISYVKSFRDDFASEIAQKGLEAVIQRMEAQAASRKQS